MKLTNQDTKQLLNILNACSICGIESVIIEQNLVRGVNESKTCAIISSEEIPNICQPGQTVGLTRISSLYQRISLLSDDNSLASIDAKESDKSEITSFDIVNGKNKVQFRCTNAALIKAPRVINDEPLYSIILTQNELKLLIKSTKVMSAKKLALTVNKNGSVNFYVTDSINDEFTVNISTSATLLDSTESSVTFYYPVDIFEATIKNDNGDNVEFILGQAGTIRTCVKSHIVTLLPQVNESDED